MYARLVCTILVLSLSLCSLLQAQFQADSLLAKHLEQRDGAALVDWVGQKKQNAKLSPKKAARLNYYLGQAYIWQQQFDLAERHLKKALQKQQAIALPLAETYGALADLYIETSRPKEAKAAAEEALKIRRENPDIPKHSRVLDLRWLGYADFLLGNLEAAETAYQKALDIQVSTLGKNHKNYLSVLNDLALLRLEQGRYEEVERLFKEIAEGQEQLNGRQHPATADALNNLGIFYHDEGQYEAAENYYQQGANIRRTVMGEEHLAYAGSSNNLALLYLDMNRYLLSEQYFLKAKAIYEKVFGVEHEDYAMTINNMAVLYRRMGRIHEALVLYESCAGIYKQLLGAQHSYYAMTLSNLSTTQYDLGELEKAIQLAKEALSIYQLNLGPDHPHCATNMANLANLYMEQDEFDQAERLLQQSAKIRVERFGKQHPEYLSNQENLAILYLQTGRYQKALELFEEVSQSWKSLLGAQHPSYLQSLNNLADHHGFTGDTAKSEYYALLSLRINAHLSPQKGRLSPAEVQSIKQRAPHSLAHLLHSLDLLYQYSDPSNHQLRWVYSDLALALFHQLRNDFSAERDKLRSLAEGHKWLGRSLAILETKGDSPTAFRLAEQQKSVLLLEAAQTQEAYRFGDLPPELAKREQDLQAERASLRASLLENRPDAERDSLQRLLADLNININTFQQEIEQAYPEYAALKYRQASPGVEKLREQLSAQSALVEYVWTDSALYAFYLDAESLRLERLNAHPRTVAESIEVFRESLSNPVYLQEQPLEAYRDYAENAYWLYREVLAPLIAKEEGIRHLIIIPDGPLSHIPFEALITEAAPKDSPDYKSLSYLLKKYSTTYNYAASLWHRNRSNAGRAINHRMLALAPPYASGEVAASRLPVYRQLRQQLQRLPAAEQEVQQLAEYFEGSFLWDNRATEAYFKETASDYGLIHLAMHGLLDKQRPLLSSLAFAENQDSSENNFLQAYEISQLKLRAELVFLSACETGLGKFERGNGTASLARAFMYAGAQALVVSLWQVNDQATAVLSRVFYQGLQKGLDKAEALRQAKLHYLEKAKGFAAHPAYWSAFIQLGDERPLAATASFPPYGYWILGGLGLSVLGLFLWRWRRQ